jgi:hypothetical protein
MRWKCHGRRMRSHDQENCPAMDQITSETLLNNPFRGVDIKSGQDLVKMGNEIINISS